MIRWLLAFSAIFALVGASPAYAEEQTASSGAVIATFSFEADEETGYSDLWLTIVRGEAALYDAPVSAEDCEEPACRPGTYDGGSIAVADLDGDSEPEVVLSLYWGGAHCCTIVQVFAYNGGGYRIAERNLGNPGFDLDDIDGDNVTELVTRDDRFAYRYAAYAFSVLPVQVLAWDGQRWNDDTAKHRGLVRGDLRDSWRLLSRAQRRGYETRGAAAAWAANRYRLGKRRSTLTALRRMAREGKLEGFPSRNARKFVTTLDQFLIRSGYGR